MVIKGRFRKAGSFICLCLYLASMIGAIHAELFVYSEMQCEDLCLRSANCSGYELETKEGDSKKKCHLISNKHETLLLRDRLALKCNPNPCKHGGTCIKDPRKCRKIFCTCKKNWTGTVCEIEVKDAGGAVLSDCA